jgi:hypothetical protein
MAGARIAPTEAPSGITAVLVLFLFSLFWVLTPAASAASPTTVTHDFSQHGQGPFDQSYFDGTRFTEGSFVGYIQGDDALIGPVAGSTSRKFSSISARFAPALQGTAAYTLTVYKGSGRTIASNSMIVTQDTGEPQSGQWGYVTIALDGLPNEAKSFRLSNTFVRSSYSHITQIEFGVASITYSR